ncbi:hypothetical protein [Dokdonella ginsengisoli]|uniref:GNAT family N-acetyltransferase n=1 Tax=Dokdonella ginsengisoli TaxID=363846 RepID=A0ABV9QXJ5_9GAMM
MSDAFDDFIIVTEVDRGPAFAAAIFERKYRARVPDFRHHVVAFWKRADGSFVPVSYVHFTDWGDIMAIGGACTDGDLLRRMSDAERAEIDRVGGINRAVTRYSLDRFAPRCDAVFGNCGDERSWGILSGLGFERVRDPHLIARWSRPLDAERQRELIEKAAAFAPF